MRITVFLLSFAVILPGFLTTSQAQTVGFADAIKILAMSCGKDIDTYCKSSHLANNGISSCLEVNAAKLSSQCNVDRVKVAALIEARFAAQAAAPGLCDADAQQRCKLVKQGGGRVLRCLLKAQRTVSKKCNTAIDLAGYR